MTQYAVEMVLGTSLRKYLQITLIKYGQSTMGVK